MTKNSGLVLVVGLWLVLVWGSQVGLAKIIKNRPDQRVPATAYIPVSSELSAQIVPRHNNLNILLIPVRNFLAHDKNQYLLTVQKQGQVIRQLQFPGNVVGGQAELRMQFEPIADSQDQTLKLSLKPLAANDGFQAGINPQSFLGFSSLYRQEGWSWLGVHNFIDYLFSDKLFLVIWLGLVLMCGVKYYY